MNLDDFKDPWQQQQRDLDDRVDHVVKAVRSRMSWFDRVIWFRDLRESVAAVLVFVWFGYDFFQRSQWLAKFGTILGMLACIMIVVILNWARLTGRVARPGQPLQDYCTAELARVDRQIWLLRNVNWWYTGPLFLAVTIELFGLMPEPAGLIFPLTFLLPFGWFIYWLNQRAVRLELMPLRHELASAMEVTDDDDAVVQDGTVFSTTERKKLSRRRVILAITGLLALAFGGAYLFEHRGWASAPPKLSPFTDVQFEGEQVIVTFDGQTYQWLELDGIEVEDIVTSSKRRFWWRWQKRIREDLVEVLWGMDHRPGNTVKLRLLDLETMQTLDIENAPMTYENRQAIYAKQQQAKDQ